MTLKMLVYGADPHSPIDPIFSLTARMRDDYPSVPYSIDIILTKNIEQLRAQRTLYGTTLRSQINRKKEEKKISL